MRNCSLTLLVALLLGIAPTGRAAVLTNTDLGTIALGAPVAGPSTSDFLTSLLVDIGDLSVQVFRDPANIFTYVMSITSEVSHISEINLGFAPLGFNGVAGYSFLSVDLIDDGDFDESLAFTIHQDDDGTIDWNTNDDYADSSVWWNEGETLMLFFQSTNPPGDDDVYNMINSRASSTLNIAPGAPLPGGEVPVIPEPATFILLGTGCALMICYRLIALRAAA